MGCSQNGSQGTRLDQQGLWGEGLGRGAGVENWDRYLVHLYADRTALGARWYPTILPPWGVHGYSTFRRFALVVKLQNKMVPSAGLAGWLAGLG